MQCHLWPAAGSHGSAPWPGPRTGAVGVLSAPPPGGGARHGTVVRSGAVEAGLGPCVGQLAARSAALWVLFRLPCFGGGAGAAQVVCVHPGCLGREGAGGANVEAAAHLVERDRHLPLHKIADLCTETDFRTRIVNLALLSKHYFLIDLFIFIPG